jgi:glycosyltransferase involved in cell wall biosynthesis
MKDKLGAKKVMVACGTKFHSDYVAEQLNKHDLLVRVITSHPRTRYINRTKIPNSKIKFLFPIFALAYLLKKIPFVGASLARAIEYRLPAIFDIWASKRLGTANISITWSWSGLKTIKAMKNKGGITILEECGSYNIEQNKILTEEYTSLGLSFNNKTPDHILKREFQEVSIADYILCPSKYVAESLIKNGVDQEKCVIIPYGVNLSIFHSIPKAYTDFTVLFVGTIGVRKGLIYLFKALELINQIHRVKCFLIGSIEDSFAPVYDHYSHLFTHVGNVNQNQLANYYNNASVFVLPSLDEGMAYVQLEAMACGLPVICTPNSGGDSVIMDGKEGYIVPIRNYEVLAEKIIFLKENRDILTKMSEDAVVKAKEFTWDAYGEKLASFINNL